jgi:hypothetical protein
MTQNNLGNALEHLGERESGTARLEDTIRSFTLAIDVYHSAGANRNLSVVESNRKRAEAELTRHRSE